MTVKELEKAWVSKDRTYQLQGLTPLTYKIKGASLLHFDEDKKVNREIRYAINQKSIFVDEQDDNIRMEHIVFGEGFLRVPYTNPLLQKMLSIYHPDAGIKWIELDPQRDAEDQLTKIETELEAVQLVASLDIEHLEAILRTEVGSAVTSLSSKELKRDCFIFAKRNPKLFVEISKDEDIKLRNLANRAVESGILQLTDDGTVFKFANGKKIMTVPFEVHPYAALSQYFKTDEGVGLMKSIIKKLD